jgi:hypothetical protein
MNEAQRNYSPVVIKLVHWSNSRENEEEVNICAKIDRTYLREYIANTVTRNIRRSAYTRITVENVVGITFIMTRINIVASVMGIRREGTLLSLR